MSYPIFSLFFMRIKGEDYCYLGQYNDECGRVYIPTLNKSYARDEVIFCGQLTDEYVAGVKGPNKKIKYETDDFGYLELYSRKELTNGDIKKIEKNKNNITITPSKKNNKFYR